MTKPRAFCYIRDMPHYRRDAFVAGFNAAGFDTGAVRDAKPGDVMVIWNRYGEYDQIATAAEKRGVIVFVSENGFIGTDAQGRQLYQLAIGGHNGSGFWGAPLNAPPRLLALGIEVSPWQAPNPDGHVVVRGQRGIGRPRMASPPNWHIDAANRLRKLTKRRILVVPHPGVTSVTDRAHETYLTGAHALVVWSSSVGVKALAMGVPVISEANYWVCKSAAARTEELESGELRTPERDALRREALERMAWAQWTLEEIASGYPVRHLLALHEKHLQQAKVPA